MKQFSAIGLSYGTYLLVGTVLTILGPLIPEIIDYYHISYSAIGLAVVLNSLAYLPAVLFGGLFCTRYGSRRVNIIGLIVMAVGYITMSLADSWWLFVVGYCIGGGFGFGLVEAALNSLVMEQSVGQQGTALNMLHVYAAIGAVLGPVAARSLVAITGEWQTIYLLLAVVYAFAAGLFYFYPLQQVHPKQDAYFDGKTMIKTLCTPTIGILALAMTFYVGAEIGLSNWMYSYVVLEVGGSNLLGASLNSLFWVGLGLGRLISAYASEKYGYERYLSLGSAAAAMALLPVVIWQHTYIVTLSFFLTGFLFAGTFPTILAIGSRAVPDQNGTVAGVLIFFAGIGTMIFPPAMGYLADNQGIWYAMLLALICVVALAGSTAVLSRIRHSSGRLAVEFPSPE